MKLVYFLVKALIQIQFSINTDFVYTVKSKQFYIKQVSLV